ncbi:Heat shock transcription factor [Coemansia sp. S146]|nr:Heat shock transcription factor [Coemansia sp. S146]
MSGTIAQRGNNMHRRMSPFLNKLLSMVGDEPSDNLIQWAEDSLSFVMLRREEFAKEILPRFFKHANFPSFVQQVNMYGFRKVPHLQQGGLISEGPGAESWEFRNKHFRRGQLNLLDLIHRKKGTVANEKDIIDGADDDNGEALSSKLKRLGDENRLLHAQARAADEQAKLQRKTIDALVQLVVCGFENGSKLPELSTPPLGSISNSSDLVNDVGNSDGGSSAHYGQSLQQQQQQPPAKRRRFSPDLTQSSGHKVGDGSTPTLRHKGPSPQSTALTSTLRQTQHSLLSLRHLEWPPPPHCIP